MQSNFLITFTLKFSRTGTSITSGYWYKVTSIVVHFIRVSGLLFPYYTPVAGFYFSPQPRSHLKPILGVVDIFGKDYGIFRDSENILEGEGEPSFDWKK